MRIRETRLPLSQVASLQPLAIQSADSFRPLLVPVYLLLEKNQKLISIKSPFDFFTPNDLEKLGPHTKLYLSPFITNINPFTEAAFEVRQTLDWSDTGGTGALGPTSFEISDAVLRILAKLWAETPLSQSELKITEEPNQKSPHIGIESFFLAVFTNQFCDPLPSDWVRDAREQDIENYEHALLKAGAMIFFALHLGYLDFNVLNRIYRRVFSETANVHGDEGSFFISKELQELRQWIDTVIPSSEIGVLSSDFFQVGKNRAAKKLQARLSRVRNELLNPESIAPSVFGAGGIYDV